ASTCSCLMLSAHFRGPRRPPAPAPRCRSHRDAEMASWTPERIVNPDRVAMERRAVIGHRVRVANRPPVAAAATVSALLTPIFAAPERRATAQINYRPILPALQPMGVGSSVVQTNNVVRTTAAGFT